MFVRDSGGLVGENMPWIFFFIISWGSERHFFSPPNLRVFLVFFPKREDFFFFFLFAVREDNLFHI